MSILFFDVETTGFYQKHLDDDDPRQPRVVQFAAILTDDEGKAMGEASALVRPPPDFEIPAGATSVHGITTEAARDFGISELSALALLDDLATGAKLLVAHNIEFDSNVINCMYARDRRVLSMFCGGPATAQHFCTMHATTNICKLPGKYGGDYKWPKLQEAYTHLFGKPFDGAHDALADVRACKEIYFKLKNEDKPF